MASYFRIKSSFALSGLVIPRCSFGAWTQDCRDHPLPRARRDRSCKEAVTPLTGSWVCSPGFALHLLGYLRSNLAVREKAGQSRTRIRTR